MSRFRQPFRPALARKAGQLDPQTLVGSLGARHGTSRSKSVAITMRSRDIELQNTKELRATAARHCGSKTGSNLDAAITICFAASRGKPACIYAPGNRTWQQSFSHYTAICNQRFNKRNSTTHAWTTTRCRTPRENRSATETIQAAPTAHTSCPSSPAAATLHGKTQGFVLRLSPPLRHHSSSSLP